MEAVGGCDVPDNVPFLVVETDLEPDDSLALHVLARQHGTIPVVVVGESLDVVRKIDRLMTMDLRILDIVVGLESMKDYPAGPVFDPSGCLRGFFEQLRGKYKIMLMAKVPPSGPVRMILLKPPRELMALFMARDPEILALLARSTAVMYGSFNVRCLLVSQGGLYTAKDVEEFFGAFSDFFYYDNHAAVGEENTANDESWGPANIDRVRALPGMADIMDRWDAFVLADCEETLSALDALPQLTEGQAARRARNAKCAEQVRRSAGRQFVLADVGVVLSNTPTDYRPARLVIDEVTGYVTAEDPAGEPTTTHIVNYLGRDEVLRRLSQALF
jgi:hypothetical protein